MTPFFALCATMYLHIDHPELCAPAPPLVDLCVSITNYWPFDDNNQLQPFRGQADSDPYHTADMTPVSLDLEWRIAAGPMPLMGHTYTFPNGWTVRIADTFGKAAYQAGAFWHYTYSRFVWALDILTSEPLHYLECRGR